MYYLVLFFFIFGIILCLDRSLVLKYVFFIFLIIIINYFFDLNFYLKVLFCVLSVGSSGSIFIFLFLKLLVEFLYFVFEVIGCFWVIIMFERFFDVVYFKKIYAVE